MGTTMRPPACFTTFPRPAVELTDEQIFWAGLKHFLCDFRSGFTIEHNRDRPDVDFCVITLTLLFITLVIFGVNK